tara:strand:+ start:2759 stop:3313 length:555 start_codon:yes stop_codon:yes gene_type:complete
MPITLNGSTGIVTGLAALPDSAMSSGSIIHVVSTTKTNSQSSSTSTYADINGFSLSITPSSSSNKIFVQTALVIGAADNSFLGFKVFRDSTAIGLNGGAEASGNITPVCFGYGYAGSNVSYRGRGVSWQHLDTPGDTNSHTYKVQFASLYNNQAVYINRPATLDTNYNYSILGSSSFTLMEVAA